MSYMLNIIFIFSIINVMLKMCHTGAHTLEIDSIYILACVCRDRESQHRSNVEALDKW